MKKQFLLLAGAVFTAATLFAQQVENGGFETWTNSLNPDHWQTLGSLINPIAAPLATQEQSTVFEGASSVKLTTTTIPQVGTIPGQVVLGEDEGTNQYLYGGIPFAFQPDTFWFAYNYTPSNPSDSAGVEIYFWKGGQASPQASIVNGGYLPLASTGGQWAKVYVPLTSSWSDVPDSLFITFMSSKDTASVNAGSVLYVDDISFGYVSAPTSDPTVTLSVSPVSATISEGQSALFTATLSEAAVSDVTVNIAVPPGGTATFGSDYLVTGLTGTSVVIPAGQTSASVTLNALTDSDVEPAETVIVSLAPGTGYVLGNPSSATLTINDVPVGTPVVSLSVSPASVVEGESATFTATLSVAASADLTVPYTLSGNATEGNDFSGTGSDFSFPAGATTATVNVATTDDTEVEGDETLTITLSAGTGYILGTASATLTITDNDGTGIKETGAMEAIRLYPNPATTSVNVYIPAEIAAQNIIITDVTGRAVKLVNNVSGVKAIVLDGLANGSYIVTFTDASTKAFTGSKQLHVAK